MKKLAKGMLTATSLLFGAVTAQALEVGQSAPLFTADSNRGEISLAEVLEEKNAVLAFYFADFTPV
jgi:hypothetical protein